MTNAGRPHAAAQPYLYGRLPVLAFASALSITLPSYAQQPDPFQSAPGPAATAKPTAARPPPARRPAEGGATQPEPPRGTSSPQIETVFWQTIAQSRDAADFEEYLRRYPQGQFAGLARNRLAVLRTAPTTTPPPSNQIPAGSLAGRWSGTVSCSYGTGGLELDAVAVGPDRYSLTGSEFLGSFTGSILGTQVRFEETKLINHVYFQGSIKSPTSMGGTYRQGLSGETCSWSLTKD